MRRVLSASSAFSRLHPVSSRALVSLNTVAPFPNVGLRFKSCGILGLPNVGKSSLFNALTRTQKAQSANYPFCTIEPNVAMVAVPDARLDKLAAVMKSEKTLYQQLEFVDIAGLVKGAHKGEGLGNKFLSNVRHCTVLLHVLRSFINQDIVHVSAEVNPVIDLGVIETELILADLDTISKRMANKKKSDIDPNLLTQCEKILDSGHMLNTVAWTAEQMNQLNTLGLLTMKPMAFVCNVDEDSAKSGNEFAKAVEGYVASLVPPAELVKMGLKFKPSQKNVVNICASLEEEATKLGDEEAQKEFLQLADLDSTGLDKVIALTAELLDIHCFYTIGPKEARAWEIPRGATAVEAAAKIHSDIARGFICAEVMKTEDFLRLGSEQAVKAAGLMASQPKTYVMQDGDIVHFKFNVTKNSK